MADSLIIRISGDAKAFNEELEKVRAKTEDLDAGLQKIATLSGVAFAALTAEIGFSIHAYGEADLASRKLTNSLENQGIYSKELADSYKEQAKELQKKTGLDDDAVVAAQAHLQAMIGQTEITSQLTGAIADLAEAQGISLESSAELIGKGIAGQTTSFQKLGIEIDQGLTRQERLAQIIDKVNQRFGGQAEQAGKGAYSIRGLMAAFGDLQEEIGSRFTPTFEAATVKLTSFVSYASQSEGLVTLGSAIIGAGAAMTGFISVLAALGVAFNAASALAAAFGTTLAVALGPITLVAAAVAALGAGVAYYIVQSNHAASSTDELKKKIADTQREIERLQQIVNDPGRSIWFQTTQEDVDKAKAKLVEYQKQLQVLEDAEQKKAKAEADRLAAKKALADQEEAEQRRRDDREMLETKEKLDVLKLENESASKDLITLKKQEYEILKQLDEERSQAVRDQLQNQLAETRLMEEEAAKADREQRRTLNDEILEENEEYQALSADQKAVFRAQNEQILADQIQTEDETYRSAALARAQKQIQDNNVYLENERKFGKAYAEIYRAMHSEIYTGSKQAFGELAELQQSSSSELKAIGKAAAIANIIIKTGESAMNIFAGFSTIPIIGPALGVAGAAAAIAFGAEQVGRVTAAAQGGLITGGIPGVDSVPVLAQQGELVAPTQNFEEVIGSVRAAREAEKITGRTVEGSQDDTPLAHVVLELVGDAAQFIETKIVERRRLGISLLPATV